MPRLAARPAVIALALLACAGATAAAGPDLKLSDLLRGAYKNRREGNFVVAAMALEGILERLDRKSPQRHPLAMELAQLFIVMGKPYRAVVVYRKEKDVPREIATLLSMKQEKRTKEALTLARLERYGQGEARALVALGQTDEALGVLLKGGKALASERGELLLTLKRYKEANEAFGESEDYYGQARALEMIPESREQAKHRYEDAGTQLKLYLKLDALPRRARAEAAYKKAASGPDRERARLYLAQCYGELGDACRRWAKCFAGSANPRKKEQALKSGDRALGFYKLQRDTLEDRAVGGGDLYGIKAVEVLGVAKAIQETEADLAKYQAMPDDK
ncbi:MAG: hypothetical protein AB7N76_34505 [Planctomycetota bacterium]